MALGLVGLAGCLGKGQEQKARENVAEFWDSHSSEFDSAQQRTNEGLRRYKAGLYSRSEEKAQTAYMDYDSLELLCSSRADDSNSEYEEGLFGMVRDIAFYGREAAVNLREGSVLQQRPNPPTEEIQEHELQFDEHMDLQSEAVDELITELDK